MEPALRLDTARRLARETFRKLRRSPGFTLLALFTLAVALGANVAVFSLVHGILVQPLPYPESDRLAGVWLRAPGLAPGTFQLSEATYLLSRESDELFDELGISRRLAVNVLQDGEPQRLEAARVTPSVLSVLGMRPHLGRTFTEAEQRPGEPPVTILSHDLWQGRFGGARGVLGESLVVDGVAREIVGVAPPGFHYPAPEVALWIPFTLDPAAPDIGSFSYTAVARLGDGVTFEGATAGLTRAVLGLPERFPGEITRAMMEKIGLRADVHPLKEDVVEDVGEVLWVLLGTVGLILLIACANVANLFLVRAEGRNGETAVRAALGAGRGQLSGGYLMESTLLGLGAGGLGLGLAEGALRVLRRYPPENLPRLQEIGLTGPVLLFALAVSLAAGLLFGLVPVARLRLDRLAVVLKEGGRATTEGRERYRLRGALVVAQVALALVLLAGSGLMVRTWLELRNVEPGFRPRGALTLRLSLPEADYPEATHTAGFYRGLLERVRALPAVTEAGAAAALPLGNSSRSGTAFEDHPLGPDEIPPLIRNTLVTEGYFDAMGIPLLAGRTFEPGDAERRTGAAVVNRALAERFWPGENPLGKRLRGWDDEGRGDPWYTVVGVVGDVRSEGLDREAPAEIFYPVLGPLRAREGGPEEPRFQEPWTARSMDLVVRADGDPMALADAVRARIRELDPHLPMVGVELLERKLDASLARTAFTLVMLLLAAAVALLLGTVGLYGVIAYAVARRRRELGVRMALGARRRDVGGLVIRQSVVLGAMGVALGLVAAVATLRLLETLLYGVGAADPVTLAAASAVLLAISVAAAWLPAHRAASTEPQEILRGE